MAFEKKSKSYRFTFGPWNISMGADPFGPPVRKEVAFATKIREYKQLGFDGVQLHDDDVVQADLDLQATLRGVVKVRKLLEGEGLFCDFIAPRLWEHPKTIDGAFTSNMASLPAWWPISVKAGQSCCVMVHAVLLARAML